MEKFPFSPQGLTDLQTMLFALPDSELQQQADLIGNDFRAFLAAHFELNPSQLTFLVDMDQDFILDAASSSKSFIERRLMITLLKAEPPVLKNPEDNDDPPKDRGKLVDLDKKETSSFSREYGYQHEETLTFKISYQSIN